METRPCYAATALMALTLAVGVAASAIQDDVKKPSIAEV
jgi:hypothetical protein